MQGTILLDLPGITTRICKMQIVPRHSPNLHLCKKKKQNKTKQISRDMLEIPAVIFFTNPVKILMRKSPQVHPKLEPNEEWLA
jgi:hypothetical protein